MGRGLAKLLAEKGANVVIVARSQQKLDEALSYISVRSFHVEYYGRCNLLLTCFFSLLRRTRRPSVSMPSVPI